MLIVLFGDAGSARFTYHYLQASEGWTHTVVPHRYVRAFLPGYRSELAADSIETVSNRLNRAKIMVRAEVRVIRYFRKALTIVTASKSKKKTFDPKMFLAFIGRGRRIVSLPKGRPVFAQGDSCDAVFYIQSGKVKLTVVSKTGKEATIAILGVGDFFGEDSLARQRLRMATVTTLSDCELMRIEKNAMLRVLHAQHTFSDLFVEHLLSRNIRYQEDLIDQLFNSSEKRLARILLIFAGFGKDGIREKTEIPKISQETLAAMVGTTRPRINAFMNKFRKLGFIDYNGELQVHSSLLNVVLLE